MMDGSFNGELVLCSCTYVRVEEKGTRFHFRRLHHSSFHSLTTSLLQACFSHMIYRMAGRRNVRSCAGENDDRVSNLFFSMDHFSSIEVKRREKDKSLSAISLLRLAQTIAAATPLGIVTMAAFLQTHNLMT